MLGVITFKWKTEGFKHEFTARHVNVLARMVQRNYDAPHKFYCVTDDPEGLDDDIEYVPLWGDFSDMASPYGPSYPSCYRRLKLFSAEAKKLFGERFVSLDLDCVIVGDMKPVWDRPEDIILWGKTNPTTLYNGSMLAMKAGSRRQVWDHFDPASSPDMARKARQFGSDQGWISYKLGPGEAMWTTGDGVYSYVNHIARNGGQLPENARIIHFHGKLHKPWSPEPQSLRWVRKNWC